MDYRASPVRKQTLRDNRIERKIHQQTQYRYMPNIYRHNPTAGTQTSDEDQKKRLM